MDESIGVALRSAGPAHKWHVTGFGASQRADVRICGRIKWTVLTVNAAQWDDITVDEFLNGPEWISEHRASQCLSQGCSDTADGGKMCLRGRDELKQPNPMIQHQLCVFWYSIDLKTYKHLTRRECGPGKVWSISLLKFGWSCFFSRFYQLFKATAFDQLALNWPPV